VAQERSGTDHVPGRTLLHSQGASGSDMRLDVMFHFKYLFLFWLLLYVPGVQAANTKVDYDRKSDKLSIQAEGTSLRELFGVISLKTGMEIVMSPKVEQQVSVNVENKPLPDALKSMGRSLRLNRVMIFGERPDGPPLLLRMKILPQGENDSVDLEPVVTVEQEVVSRSRPSYKTISPEAGQSQETISPETDMSAARWQNRLKELPRYQQQHLAELASKLEERNAARELQKKQSKAEREARHAEREARRTEQR